MRDIQDTRDCTDCAWIAQVTDPVIVKELESAWIPATYYAAGELI